MTFDDEVLFDAHRRTAGCIPPLGLDLVAVDGVWYRLLAAEQTAACSLRVKTTGVITPRRSTR